MQIEIKDIKKGDRFWDKWLEFEAIEDGRFFGMVEWYGGEKREQWVVSARSIETNEGMTFLATQGSPYNPDLSDQNEYLDPDSLRWVENGK